MKPFRSYHVRREACALIVVYFSIVLGHLFPAPSFQPSTMMENNAITGKNNQKDAQLIYNLIRTDRCTWNGNKTLKVPIEIPLIFVNSFAVRSRSFVPAGNTLSYYFLSDHHFSYLSNRMLRI